MEKTTKLRDTIIVISLISCMLLILIFAASFAINDSYRTEQDTLNDAYRILGLGTPTYNETTKFFELENGNDMYVGFLKVNNTETSTAIIIKFTNFTETVTIGNRVLYVSDNDEIVYQKNVNRRFN